MDALRYRFTGGEILRCQRVRYNDRSDRYYYVILAYQEEKENEATTWEGDESRKWSVVDYDPSMDHMAFNRSYEDYDSAIAGYNTVISQYTELYGEYGKSVVD